MKNWSLGSMQFSRSAHLGQIFTFQSCSFTKTHTTRFWTQKDTALNPKQTREDVLLREQAHVHTRGAQAAGQGWRSCRMEAADWSSGSGWTTDESLQTPSSSKARSFLFAGRKMKLWRLKRGKSKTLTVTVRLIYTHKHVSTVEEGGGGGGFMASGHLPRSSPPFARPRPHRPPAPPPRPPGTCRGSTWGCYPPSGTRSARDGAGRSHGPAHGCRSRSFLHRDHRAKKRKKMHQNVKTKLRDASGIYTGYYTFYHN